MPDLKEIVDAAKAATADEYTMDNARMWRVEYAATHAARAALKAAADVCVTEALDEHANWCKCDEFQLEYKRGRLIARRIKKAIEEMSHAK